MTARQCDAAEDNPVRNDNDLGCAGPGLEPSAASGSASIATALAAALSACVESAAATSERSETSLDLYPTDELRIRLRDCVRDYTETMRGTGAQPEQVLKSVKVILHDAAPSVESYSALATDVSRWCIEAYFERE
jgi:hypothetical protein